MAPVITRFAPSPTGLLHAGNYRTAIFAYLYAKKHGGTFLLRIEDTDTTRSKKEFEENILESLSWLHLPHDGFFRQSERVEHHTQYLQKLIDGGHAYVSKEEGREEGERSEVIRFKNPGGIVTFTDLIRGDITTDISDLNDFVIAKSMTEPVFHLAVVADDADMGITHVIRGEDHISNTPRQIVIQRALGLPTPTYAHLPLILAPDRTKLSKRRGAKSLTEYRDLGFLKEAMFNYLTLLGWNPGTDQEYFSEEELISLFDFSRVQKGGAIFDEIKLTSINQYWLRKLSDEDLVARAALESQNRELLYTLLPIIRERAKTLLEAREMLVGELSFFFETPTFEKELLLPKKEREGNKENFPALFSAIQKHLLHTKSIIEVLTEAKPSPESVEKVLLPYAEEEGKSMVLWPLRVALSGKERSPDPFTIISILGKDEVVERITRALAILL